MRGWCAACLGRGGTTAGILPRVGEESGAEGRGRRDESGAASRVGDEVRGLLPGSYRGWIRVVHVGQAGPGRYLREVREKGPLLPLPHSPPSLPSPSPSPPSPSSPPSPPSSPPSPPPKAGVRHTPPAQLRGLGAHSAVRPCHKGCARASALLLTRMHVHPCRTRQALPACRAACPPRARGP